MATVLTLCSRHMSTSLKLSAAIKNVTVIGGGLMGSGIAQAAAQTGHNVTVVDVSKDVLNKSKEKIETSLAKITKKLYPDDKEKGVMFSKETLERLKYETDGPASVKGADLVIEAVVENIDLKCTIFSAIDPVAPQHTIFTTNTSSLLVGDIAKVTQRLDRFGGLHFFIPVPVNQLVEVIRTPNTSDETHKALMEFGASLGKTTIEAKDSDGFIVNRLLLPYLMESIRMLERGDASAKDIDLALKLGLGYPMGPFQLMDFSGLDTLKFIVDGWHKKHPENKLFESSPLLDRLISEGKLGLKTGQGFYTYKKEKSTDCDSALIPLLCVHG